MRRIACKQIAVCGNSSYDVQAHQCALERDDSAVCNRLALTTTSHAYSAQVIFEVWELPVY